MSTPTVSNLPPSASSYLFNHVFFSTKLPQSDDYSAEHESTLLSTVVQSLREFKVYLPSHHGELLKPVVTMLARLREIRGKHGELDEGKLIQALKQLETEGGFLPIHIQCQNAAALMTKNDGGIHVEVFELSPPNAAVYSTPGRLQRQFPGPAFTMSPTEYNDQDLWETIAQTLARMSHQSVPGTKPKVKKAGHQHDEDRDTTDPRIVTEFFTSFLPYGSMVRNTQIHKNTREEVHWLDARMPWRRSSLWLLIRVTMQLVFGRLCRREGIPDDLYKHFMVFYMASALRACSNQICSSQRHIMNAKISRRLNKIDLSHQPRWFPFVQESLERSHAVTLADWDAIMARSGSRIDQNQLAKLDFHKDIDCSLPALDKWIEAINHRQNCPASANFHPHKGLVEFGTTELPSSLNASDPDYNILKLTAFESWVNLNLDHWLHTNLNNPNTCEQLGRLIENYYGLASPLYSGNPEATSNMVLIILELWIACDKSATEAHPLLLQYDACIPMDVVESFVLPHRSQMERLSRVEDYMRRRKLGVVFSGSNIFQDFGTRSCFSVKYFDQSWEHQELRHRIEALAESQRNQKRLELQEKQERYRRLYSLVDQTSCTYYEVTPDSRFDYKEQRHSNACNRCSQKSEADSITIDIHEWPLPAKDLEVKTTVFELNTPRSFAFWREITSFLLFDVLRVVYSHEDKARAVYRPKTYSGLSSFFTSVITSPRLSLLSQDKPHERTHRRQKRIIDVTEQDVCLQNGMNFHFFDDHAKCFVASVESTDKVAKSCTYGVSRSNASLQKFLVRPASERNGPSPNTVIASQDACPISMSLEEYRALCSMPLGLDIQWENILRELAMPTVVFNKADTCIFILQISCQAGPSFDKAVLRKGHSILNNEEFTSSFLVEIERAASRITENWESAQELSALILLTQRIMSLSKSTEIKDMCLSQLSTLRATSFEWAGRVREKAGSADTDTRRNDLISRSTHLALVCASTYDSDKAALEQILQNDHDASLWIQCCMMIHDRKGLLDLGSGSFSKLLFYRWQLVAYRCYPILVHNVVSQKQPALDLAIKEAWAAYHPRSPWSVVSGSGHHWLVTRDGSLLVHFNLLLGELLINGRPLARLPSEYERHGTYKTLFGSSPVEVMPSELPGMDFSGQRKHMGQTIHLGKETIPGSGDIDICVRATSDKGRAREFVPLRLLNGAFPDAFVEGYAHWYDMDGGYVEFCPLKEPWNFANNHWRLQRKDEKQSHWCLVNSDISLISTRSQTAKALHNILQPLERLSQMHCKLHTPSSLLEIEIPRLRLSFNLGLGDTVVCSRQYRGFQIDSDQSLGTLVGLRNKLILIHESTQDRKVLIPEGTMSWEANGSHHNVNIAWQAVSNVHVYSVNAQLLHLKDNGSLQSKLILSYLHGLTSFCLPDPSTSKTGTEQSLSILRSASVRSFTQLQPENISLLRKLAQLTPGREFYPANERVMQKVQWQNGLSCLSQHDDFREQVAAIFEQHNRMRMFSPKSPECQDKELMLPGIDRQLFQRSRIRSSFFRATEFGAEDFTAANDSPYTERGQNRQSEACLRVFSMCKTLREGALFYTQTMTRDTRLLRLWEILSKFERVHGTETVVQKARIRYDSTWLQDPVEFVATNWCGIHQLFCSQASRPNKYQAMIWLSALSLSGKLPMSIVETLAALYILPSMEACMPPPGQSFRPREGYVFSKHILSSQIPQFKHQQTPESSFQPQRGESYKAFKTRVSATRTRNKTETLNRFIANLQGQWPILSPAVPSSKGDPEFSCYFDVQRAINHVRQTFSTWFHNKELREYLQEIATIISGEPARRTSMPSCSRTSPVKPPRRKSGFFSLDDILGTMFGPAPTSFPEPPHLGDLMSTDHGSLASVPRLLELVCSLELQAKSEYESHYVKQLQGSTASLQGTALAKRITVNDSELRIVIMNCVSRCEANCEEIYAAILKRMTLSDVSNGPANHQRPFFQDLLKTQASINIAPRFSPELFLQQLTRKRWSQLPAEWRVCFIAYGKSITALQRAKRLACAIGNREDLLRELQTPGHTNWDPYEYPESLLLEIENGLLIRESQEQIAQQVRNTAKGQNAVMQLNMGEGKSSVIVPIVAAALADGSCLVRVLVAKPQSKQMFHMLVSKLGGLLGRRVYHLPVSRSLMITEPEAREIERMCLECRTEGGVLLVQPEHILSLKLMCLERFVQGKEAVAKQLLRTLEFFQETSRDVVDESDENFSVKFELIYTMGTQRSLELSPERWILIQQLLDLVRRYIPAVKAEFPQSVKVEEHCPGSFPRTRLLHEEVASELLKWISEHICNHGIGSLPIPRQPEATRKAVLSYILNLELSAEEIAAVEGDDATGFWTDSTRDPLLLLRGLLAGGVLASCLGQKRWRVNYGPDDSRRPETKLSVPYRAKDNPAPRSEFSHPDVVVVLTCLSYYYGGLSDEHLLMAFGHLVKSDQAEAEYQRWVDDAPRLSHAYRQLNGINLEDHHHYLKHVFPSLRFSKGAIDYFLAHIVFPKEMKEFPDKLSASGWDIGEIKSHPTAGFSGTNDSRVTLPLSVKQLDLYEQNHTNALVLEYLLRPENSVVPTPTRRPGPTSSDAQILLDMVVSLDPPTQVILDVGAQILELTNLEVAQTWLTMVPDNARVQAVVFVSSSDEICVIDRNGLVEPLQISPFATQLDACLVFLDEAHTRGIDLKLPPYYRAAVTLGAGITKDKLVQACMRMRKLGKGQSVIFCVPQEIEAKILAITGKTNGRSIDVADVLRWSISETWVEMQRSIPLWAIQGERYERQSSLWRKARQNGEMQMDEAGAGNFLEPESQTIEQRYRPRLDSNKPPFIVSSDDNDNIRLILKRCREFAGVNFHSTQLQEEQERQLAPEIQQERQIQRPPSAEPEKHSIHADLRSFVSTGVLSGASTAFKPAFLALANTSAAEYMNAAEFPSGLLVTLDYARTVQIPRGKASVLDDYQRPVQWVLTSVIHALGEYKKAIKNMIIISPFEANELRSEILKSDAVMMHLYAPRQNRTFSPLDNLNLHTIPTTKNWTLVIPTPLKIQLNIFAGQLYISSFDEYREICGFLGVAYFTAPEGLTIAADGFIVASEDEQFKAKFSKSPLKFLNVLMSKIRKNGQKIDMTHLGRVLDGKVLSEEDFLDGTSRLEV